MSLILRGVVLMLAITIALVDGNKEFDTLRAKLLKQTFDIFVGDRIAQATIKELANKAKPLINSFFGTLSVEARLGFTVDGVASDLFAKSWKDEDGMFQSGGFRDGNVISRLMTIDQKFAAASTLTNLANGMRAPKLSLEDSD